MTSSETDLERLEVQDLLDPYITQETQEQLEILSSGDNQIITGFIPSSLAEFTNLRVIQLNQNEISGPMPQELGYLTKLTHIILDNNQIEGPIIEELDNLENLVELGLNHNQLEGNIQAQVNLGNLTNLQNLRERHAYALHERPARPRLRTLGVGRGK